jgi:hypothetical protein
MRLTWDLKPNLLECILEDRIVPAPMNNLGMIVQTTSGLALVTPFPGAVSLSSLSGSGAATTASSVSGTAMPTSMYMTARGISQFTPGNLTGNPSIGGGVSGSSGGVIMQIKVGSGADEDGGPVSSTAASSRTNPAYGGNTNPIMAYIGQVSSSSSDAPTSQSTQSQAAPVPSLPSPGIVIPGSSNGTSPGGANSPMNPSFGAPKLLRGLGSSLTPSLPGGLGVGSLTSPAGSGGY